MPILGANVAFLQRLMMGDHAMLGDPGEPAGVMLVGKRRLVGAFTTYGIKAVEVAFVGGHCGW